MPSGLAVGMEPIDEKNDIYEFSKGIFPDIWRGLQVSNFLNSRFLTNSDIII